MPWKVVSGYYRYHHAVPGNLIPLAIFRHRLTRLWRTVLVRRSQRAAMSWERFYALLDRWIPAPRVLHPHPREGFDATHQYLRLQLASEVLQRAIESYREKHQGPVLNRASELFSGLTLGNYCGLTTAFGDNDKSVLVAIRRTRENVEIDGLSDGTRDQLYLALRLAAIEHHVQTVSPCPVILDDILINSDDARASATLKALADLAKRMTSDRV